MSAALVALFTLIELNKQRKSSYKPYISVVTKYFNLQRFELADSEIDLALHWSTEDQENPQDELLLRPSVQLVNIGFGTAKKVNAVWSFEYENLLEEVNKMAQKNFQPFLLREMSTFYLLNQKTQNFMEWPFRQMNLTSNIFCH